MKNILITGVSGGIGMATAKLFLKHGFEVWGLDKRQIENPPEGLRFLECDLSDIESIKAALEEFSSENSSLDVLVNNAAIQISKPVLETEPEEWDELMSVNVRAVFFAVKNVYGLIKKPGGAIVNIGSVHALATSKGAAAYAASKGALSAFTRSLALEFAEDGVRVNAVLPGAVDTEMLREGLERGDANKGMEELLKRTPLGRIGEPEEVAQAILFLADSTRSSFITGHSLVVDGGALARLATE
jgi:NAD(P)-dependent dehydrogenase (short-subunit alcohol dehydrogenase family)